MAMGFYADIAELAAQGLPFVVATVIESAGSTPQKPGSKMAVLPDGATRGTVGGGAIELQIVEAAKALFTAAESTRVIETHLTHDLGMCCGGKMKIFLERHAAQAHLWLFGAGHVACELTVLAKRVGFRVTVVDERAEWCNRERHPDADELVRRDAATVARELTGGEGSYVVVATHDHALDQACAEALVRKRFAYLGVIGSQRKAERFRMRMRAAGFTDEELSRMRSPMGLPISALSSAEIAVSVVAELISVRRAAAPQAPT